MKKCVSCGSCKPDEEFHRKTSSADGLQSSCKKCSCLRSAKWHKENIDAHSERERRHRHAHPELVMLRNAKWRAAASGIPFSISAEDVVIPEVCPALGIRLSHSRGKRGAGAASPSLDRKVPSMGYVKGNVVVISYLANAIKSNGTPEQVMAVAKWMETLIPHCVEAAKAVAKEAEAQ